MGPQILLSAGSLIARINLIGPERERKGIEGFLRQKQIDGDKRRCKGAYNERIGETE